ncbi:MAG: ABC transporter permease [Chitinophagaceae bacterium]|nr:ABC transporter permease [Chitinophagaceae bacterium]
MLKNYLVTAWRNLNKNRAFSLINIAGLAIGMAVCLLILQYVNFELSYDQFNKNAADIYRVTNDRYQNGKLVQHGTITYSAIGKALQDDYPEVIGHVRAEPWGKTTAGYQDKKIADLATMAIDNDFFTMFSYPLLAGDRATALREPHTAVISTTTAEKVFGVQKNYSGLVGRQFVLDRDTLPYKVTGVIEVPENSHLQFDILTSYSTMLTGKNVWKEADYDFTDSDFWHYIQLKHGTDYRALEAKLEEFSQRHFQGNKVSGSVEKFYLQPLSRAHLYSDYEYEIGKTGSATVVWGLFIIAVFIITIAWVNYINLSTARSVDRAKEVGVRKVTGATRGELIRQFLIESLLVNLFAFGLAIGLMSVTQKAFNGLIQTELSFATLFRPGFNGYSITIGLGALLLLGIFVSAAYPAFVLSSFRPIAVLKGKFRSSRKGIVLRKGLVIGQFAITILLITGSVVVYRQITFMSRQELGMNIDHMLIVRPPALTAWDSTFIEKENSFKHELKQISGVSGAATAGRLPGNEMARTFNVHRLEDNSGAHYTLRNMSVDYDYLNLYNMKIIAGRDFDPSDYNPDPSKLHNILLSKAAVKMLGFASPEDAIGKQIVTRRNWTVIGVVNDWHQKSLRYALEPAMLTPFYGTDNWISVKVNTGNITATMAAVKEKYRAFFPGNPFDYFFLDEAFNKQYKNDLLFGKAFTLFAGLAIVIACLGLLGLSAFGTAQRIKEIGIRKVLGASVTNIVLLLSKDFVWLVMIAFLIASPIAWWIMHQWLQDFAYRIVLSPWIFAAAGFLAVLIAIVTISFQAIKAAMATPVQSLRAE